jgi:hypothetical protein
MLVLSNDLLPSVRYYFIFQETFLKESYATKTKNFY